MSDLFPVLDLNDMTGSGPKGTPVDDVFQPLLEHVEGDTYALRIDNSTLERFQTCPRSAEYYCVDRRQGLPSIALAYGGAIHAGLEVMYREGYHNDGVMDRAQDAAREHMANHATPSMYDWRTPDWACHTLRKYHEHYRLIDSVEPIKVDGVPFVERGFSLDIGEIPVNQQLSYSAKKLAGLPSDEPIYIGKLIVLWTGRIDMAVHFGGRSDVVYCLDHKTTSIAGPSFFSDFSLAQQTVGYCWALSKILPDMPIAGLVLNAIIGRKPTPTGKALEFERATHLYTRFRVQEFIADITAHVENFVHNLLYGYFPKSTKWCFEKYGKCQYHDVCSLNTDAQRRLTLGSDQFANVTWNPLA